MLLPPWSETKCNLAECRELPGSHMGGGGGSEGGGTHTHKDSHVTPTGSPKLKLTIYQQHHCSMKSIN